MKKFLKSLINEVSSYYYPGTVYDEIPVYNEDVKIESSFFKIFTRKKNIYKKFENFYDIKEIEKSYNIFEDQVSKEIFLKVALYRISDVPLLRFPLFYSNVFDKISKYEEYKIDAEEISLWDNYIKLRKYDLSKIGHDIKMWYNPMGIIINFDIEQYRYTNIVNAVSGDTVIDCGSCYGDTALYFSEKTKGGEVYSFEFMPENIEVFEKNMSLNPKYKENIHLIKNAVSDESGKILRFRPNGPGTNCIEQNDKYTLETQTMAIDDFVENYKINKVNFIKMDIEGSEEAALKGAINTIRKFKPKLAICAYHKDDDLVVLPQLIKYILPEYKLYLKHNTISRNETVIYAGV